MLAENHENHENHKIPNENHENRKKYCSSNSESLKQTCNS